LLQMTLLGWPATLVFSIFGYGKPLFTSLWPGAIAVCRVCLFC